ncbi:MAG TPA: hypothetical protein VG276_26635 [Actinomycetes bacterium]|nr:hypothetical protein [Actinomycetes bacterium]
MAGVPMCAAALSYDINGQVAVSLHAGGAVTGLGVLAAGVERGVGELPAGRAAEAGPGCGARPVSDRCGGAGRAGRAGGAGLVSRGLGRPPPRRA